MKFIKTFDNFLNEGVNDNFLYHSTNIRNLIAILKTNKLKTSGSKEGISFSRSNNFWFGNLQYNSIRLVLSKLKLENNYKIEPFDFYKQYDIKDIKTGKIITNNFKKFDSNRTASFEYEEFVNKNITELGLYIEEIQITTVAAGLTEYKPFFEDSYQSMEDEIKKFIIKYPDIKVSMVDIDDKYINGGLINIKNKYPFVLDNITESKKKKNWENAAKPEDLKNKTEGVSLGKDKDGYFVYTHRARSSSYPTPYKIPKSKIKFIESTG